MSTTLESIKEQIKSNVVHPFQPQDLWCGKDGLRIKDHSIDRTQYQDLLNTLGIRKTLSTKVLDEPEQNWDSLRNAISTIDPDQHFGYILNGKNELVNIINTDLKEPTPLNYDDRIDSLANAVEKIGNQIQRFHYIESKSIVSIDAINNREVDCGQGDLWKFGTTIQIGYNAQQFANYFLRLICSNGMTTRENLAYRQKTRTKDVGTQYTNFAKDEAFASLIAPRVDRLKKSRASWYEISQIANSMNKEHRGDFMPEWYFDIYAAHAARNIDLDEMNARRAKSVYTNVNAYDAFNLATALASHNRENLSDAETLSLNRIASNMFMEGPVLEGNFIDIYGLN